MNLLLPLNSRVLVSVDTTYRDKYKLTETIDIQMVRDIDQFDYRMKNPVNATVISGRGLKKSQELLLNHNSICETNRICDTGLDDLSTPNIKYYCIPENEVYMYRDAYDALDGCGGWQPYTYYDFDANTKAWKETQVLIVKKVFRPVQSILVLPPKEVEDRLFVIRGNYEGNVLITDKYCYYTIYYQEVTGRDAHISRMLDNEWEVIGISHDLTAQVLKGELLIGDTPEDAKTYNDFFTQHSENKIVTL
jgi:hypothetical protein